MASKKLELKLILSGDGKQLKAVTTDAKGNVKELGNVSVKATGKMRKGMKSATRGVSGLVTKLGVAKSAMLGFAAITGGAAIAGVTAMVASSNKSIDALAKMSDKIGITTESLASLQFAGELTGVSVNTMNMALQRMTRRVSEAAQGTGEAKDAIKELGLDAQHLEDIGPDKAFIEISEAMKGVGNQSDKVRLAMKLFDSEGVALVNTMALGADGLNKAAAEADALGLAISRVEASKIEAANDAMLKISKVAEGFSNTLSIEIAPFITAIADSFTASAIEAGGFGNVATEMIENVSNGIGLMADGFHGIQIIFKILEGAGSFFGASLIGIISDIDRSLVDLLNKLPGVNLEYSETLSNIAGEFKDNLFETKAELDELLKQKIPSERITQWMNNVKKAADKNAKAFEKNTQVTRRNRLALIQQTAALEITANATNKLTGNVNQTDKSAVNYQQSLINLKSASDAAQNSFDSQGNALDKLSSDYDAVGESARNAADAQNAAQSSSTSNDSRSNQASTSGTVTKRVRKRNLLDVKASHLASKNFANGGSFIVGGVGGTDSQQVAFNASPNERVTIETPEQQRSNNAVNITINQLNLPGISNVKEFIDKITEISRTEPIALNIAETGVIAG